MVPCIPAAPTTDIAKRGPGATGATASVGARPKPWWLPCGVVPAGMQKTKEYTA